MTVSWPFFYNSFINSIVRQKKSGFQKPYQPFFGGHTLNFGGTSEIYFYFSGILNDFDDFLKENKTKLCSGPASAVHIVNV